MKNSCFENKSYVEFEKLKITRKIDKLNNLIGNYKILEDVYHKQNYEEFYRIKNQYIDEIKSINENKINTNLNNLKFPSFSINNDRLEDIFALKLVNNFSDIEKKFSEKLEKDKQKVGPGSANSSLNVKPTSSTSITTNNQNLKNPTKIHSQRNYQVQSLNQNDEVINKKKPVSKDKENKLINVFQDNLFNNKNPPPNNFIKNQTNCVLSKNTKPNRIESCERSPTEPSKLLLFYL